MGLSALIFEVSRSHTQGGQTFGKHLPLNIESGGGNLRASELFTDVTFHKSSASETECFLNRL